MISINNLTMGFTTRTLFKDVSLSIFPNEKIGLTGPNGAGKTTLFSIILGQIESVAGNVQVQKNINIGYLPQESKFTSQRTVMQEMTEGDQRIQDLMREKRKLEDSGKAANDRYGDVLEELERLGIYELENKAEQVLTGLGFSQEDFHRPILELSGGWQMRTLLAKLLVYPFDIILLDEPTNYLDLEATLWLKDFLGQYDGAFVLISHDRVFLNDVTNYTIVLEGSRMFKVKGNYEVFEQQRSLDNKTLEKKQKGIDKQRSQFERFAQRFHAQPNRASAVKNKKKLIDKLEDVEIYQQKRSIGEFNFSDIPASGYVVAQCEHLNKSYGSKQVYKDLSLEIIRGQKVCLVGPNGAGKSTLLKMLAGVVKPDAGQVKYGHQVESGYFSQTRTDVLTPSRSVIDELMASAPHGTQALKARSLLGLFNFHGDDVFKLVKVLSGGEKSRLILAKLLINPPNFMLLDEPTTHLDLDGVKALTGAFKAYTGTVCFISHDLYFIKKIADHIIDIHPGQIKNYPGGLEYYLDKTKMMAWGETVEKSIKKDYKNSQSDNSYKKNYELDAGERKQKASSGKKVKLTSRESQMHSQHKAAIKRKSQIKNEIKRLKKEQKDLETESYVKSRVLSTSLQTKDPDRLKEYGQRLKEIQKRLREIETNIKKLAEERDRISK